MDQLKPFSELISEASELRIIRGLLDSLHRKTGTLLPSSTIEEARRSFAKYGDYAKRIREQAEQHAKIQAEARQKIKRAQARRLKTLSDKKARAEAALRVLEKIEQETGFIEEMCRWSLME